VHVQQQLASASGCSQSDGTVGGTRALASQGSGKGAAAQGSDDSASVCHNAAVGAGCSNRRVMNP
jgi:hypothetical protein